MQITYWPTKTLGSPHNATHLASLVTEEKGSRELHRFFCSADSQILRVANTVGVNKHKRQFLTKTLEVWYKCEWQNFCHVSESMHNSYRSYPLRLSTVLLTPKNLGVSSYEDPQNGSLFPPLPSKTGLGTRLFTFFFIS